MKFDLDRFAKLAGLEQDNSSASTPSETRRAPGLMSEGRKVQKRVVRESAEMQQLRSIIRRETAVVLKQMNESRFEVRERDLLRTQRAKKLTEAVTMGFYGPGFGNNKSFVLGGPLTSASRFASLSESEDMDEADDMDEAEELDEADDMDEAEELDEADDMDEADEAWEGSSDDDDRMMRGGG